MLTRIKRFFLALFGKLNDESSDVAEEEQPVPEPEPVPVSEETEEAEEEPQPEETIFVPELDNDPIICKACGSMVFEGENFCTACGEKRE